MPSDSSMPTISSFKSIENTHDAYKGKDCLKVLGILKRAHNEDN